MESLHTNGELVTRTQGTGVDVVFLWLGYEQRSVHILYSLFKR